MKYLANWITCLRIVLSFFLLFLPPLGMTFIIVYLLCGVTDILDGYIARKTHTSSELGARLDSLSDLIMVVIVLYVLLPIIELNILIYTWIGFIILIRLTSVILVYFKYKSFGICHTTLNKLTGLMLFVSPLLLNLLAIDFVAYTLCILGSISAIEELLIHIISKQLDLNRKSIIKWVSP